jgi:hypothetical protein
MMNIMMTSSGLVLPQPGEDPSSARWTAAGPPGIEDKQKISGARQRLCGSCAARGGNARHSVRREPLAGARHGLRVGGGAAVLSSLTHPRRCDAGRPIGDARVPQAIGQPFDRFVPAEAEVLGARVAPHGPTAREELVRSRTATRRQTSAALRQGVALRLPKRARRKLRVAILLLVVGVTPTGNRDAGKFAG